MSEAESRGSFVDTFILLLALLVMVAGVAAFYYFAPGSYEQGVITENRAVRALMVIVGLVVGVFLAVQSAKGRALWEFARGSRVELRKVVWPTRQETIQTTIMVLIAVVVIAIMLFGLDQLVSWLFGMIVRA